VNRRDEREAGELFQQPAGSCPVAGLLGPKGRFAHTQATLPLVPFRD
jgi:hypothetical protein